MPLAHALDQVAGVEQRTILWLATAVLVARRVVVVAVAALGKTTIQQAVVAMAHAAKSGYLSSLICLTQVLGALPDAT